MQDIKSFLGSTPGLVVCAALGFIGLYLLVYHLNHLLLVIPYVFLLACPLMHLMHRGHHGHHSHPGPGPEATGKEGSYTTDRR